MLAFWGRTARVNPEELKLQTWIVALPWCEANFAGAYDVVKLGCPYTLNQGLKPAKMAQP